VTPFLWIAGRASLDLCNTRAGGRERLLEPDDIVRWLITAALSPQTPSLTKDDVDDVRRLRDGLRAALVSGDRAGVGLLADAWLDTAPGRLTVDCGTLTSEFRPEGVTVQCALVPVVLDAVAVARDHPGKVRECAAPDCDVVYLDTSRNGSRRWCSMERCGARAKATAYYRRQRG
jgi:predicted RNA-binding Zn ribbon-like protein